MPEPNIVFMGTPDFASVCLETLIKNNFKPVGVFCQPDRPCGRGHKLMPPAVKQTALANEIEVYQPQRLDDEAFDILNKLNPDIVIVVAYGKILPERFLNIARLGCINLHGSILPKLRGAAPIQWAVLNGFESTGVTIMQMDKGMDTGDILAQLETPIGKTETAAELFDRLSQMGADFLVQKLPEILSQKLTPVKQNEADATVAPMLSKEMCTIDWNKSAFEICNLVRGLNSWPIAQTYHNGNRLRVWEVSPCDPPAGSAPAIVTISHGNLIVGCADGQAVKIKRLQKDGSKAMNADEFLRGYKMASGDVLEKREV